MRRERISELITTDPHHPHCKHPPPLGTGSAARLHFHAEFSSLTFKALQHSTRAEAREMPLFLILFLFLILCPLTLSHTLPPPEARKPGAHACRSSPLAFPRGVRTKQADHTVTKGAAPHQDHSPFPLFAGQGLSTCILQAPLYQFLCRYGQSRQLCKGLGGLPHSSVFGLHAPSPSQASKERPSSCILPTGVVSYQLEAIFL